MTMRQLRSLVLSVGLGAAVAGALASSGALQLLCLGIWAAMVLAALLLDRLRLYGQGPVPPYLFRRKPVSGR